MPGSKPASKSKPESTSAKRPAVKTPAAAIKAPATSASGSAKTTVRGKKPAVLEGGGATGGGGGGEKKQKRRKKAKVDSYAIYINRVLTQVQPDMKLSGQAGSIVNSFIHDLFERLAQEAANLSKKNNHSTIIARDVETSAKLVLKGELVKHGVSEAIKATHKFTANSDKAKSV